MVAVNAVSLTACNCTFVSATVSHNYSDIGTITTACTSGRNINYQQRRINGFDVQAASNEVATAIAVHS